MSLEKIYSISTTLIKPKQKKRLLGLKSYTNIIITVSSAIKKHTNISNK